jgi:hypothetical protein
MLAEAEELLPQRRRGRKETKTLCALGGKRFPITAMTRDSGDPGDYFLSPSGLRAKW